MITNFLHFASSKWPRAAGFGDGVAGYWEVSATVHAHNFSKWIFMNQIVTESEPLGVGKCNNTLSPRHDSRVDDRVTGSSDVPEQRYGCPPCEEIELAPYPPRFPADHGALLVQHILRQSGGEPGPVLDWVMMQSNRYFEAFPTWANEDCEHSAAIDLLLWQRAGRMKSSSRWHAAREIIELLEGLEEAANSMKELTQ
jgi:hypothetical protein